MTFLCFWTHHSSYFVFRTSFTLSSAPHFSQGSHEINPILASKREQELQDPLAQDLNTHIP